MEIGFGQILAALVVVGLVVLAFRASSRYASIGLGVALVLLSGFLLETLVLDEQFLDDDLNSRIETTMAIVIPAAAGVALAASGFVRRSRRKA